MTRSVSFMSSGVGRDIARQSWPTTYAMLIAGFRFSVFAIDWLARNTEHVVDLASSFVGRNRFS